MANLATALKNEIARIARKELRDEVASLRKTVTGHRTDIAKLKRELAAASQELRRLRKEVVRNAPPVEAAGQPDVSKFRYSAERLAATSLPTASQPWRSSVSPTALRQASESPQAVSWKELKSVIPSCPFQSVPTRTQADKATDPPRIVAGSWM